MVAASVLLASWDRLAINNVHLDFSASIAPASVDAAEAETATSPLENAPANRDIQVILEGSESPEKGLIFKG